MQQHICPLFQLMSKHSARFFPNMDSPIDVSVPKLNRLMSEVASHLDRTQVITVKSPGIGEVSVAYVCSPVVRSLFLPIRTYLSIVQYLIRHHLDWERQIIATTIQEEIVRISVLHL